MIFFKWLWYSFINGFIGVFNVFINSFWWIFGLIAFVIVYWQECKESSDRYVDDERSVI